ncbi:hypothetical protein HYC85_010430 [Camellia sinensis]|uniref:3-methyl-2-oxobutanoate hydroxymethyltransferase n=1 Tax=Camellia sinensis TaxID=4442 RepID=A0A7J7HKL8_CAMSI|nr:hypothetical protein HYC85_010430 [Camellia sinensis]
MIHSAYDPDNPVIEQQRVATVQGLSRTGSLRLAVALIERDGDRNLVMSGCIRTGILIGRRFNRSNRLVVEFAMALQEAGCLYVVLKCVLAPVAATTAVAATSALRIPTIGIGAGSFCSGQVD